MVHKNIRINARNRYILAFLVCILSGFITILVESAIESKFIPQIENTLRTVVTTSQSAVALVTSEYIHSVTIAANIPKVINASKKLDSDNPQLAFDVINPYMLNFIDVHQYIDYFVVAESGSVLLSSSKEQYNFKLLEPIAPDFHKYVWEDKPQISFPFDAALISTTEINRTSESSSMMLIGTLIKDEAGQPIAALYVSTTPERSFRKIISNAQIGETGDSFITDKQGRIQTQGRYLNDLYSTPENSLKPIIDLSNFKPEKDQQSIAINSSGYKNYRGISAVGASIWDADNEIYIISEIDKDQAYAPIYETRRITAYIFGFYSLLIFAFAYFFNRYTAQILKEQTLLEQSKLRLRLAFENIPSGNIISNSQGIIIEFSKNAEVIFGYSSDEILGKNVSMLMPEPHRSQHDQYLEHYISTGEEKVIGKGGRKTVATHKNGMLFPVHLSIGATVIDNELHFIASITDQTVAEKIEKQLRASQKMDAIGQLTSGIAHDFNNLLGIAMGNIQLLQRKVTLDEKSAKHLSSTLQALERGVKLTRQMLNFSRKNTEATAAVDLNSSILEISKLIEQTATSSIQVNYKLKENLGFVDINHGELGDVLINLTSNARDAMPDGGSLIFETNFTTSQHFSELFPDITSTNTYLVLSISDTGVGIAKDKLDKIFEPFYTTKTRDKGTGLGLSMVYSFVQNSNGQIQVESEEGLGTSVRIFLPLSDETPLIVSDAEKEQLRGGSETILLVDDEAELLSIAQTNLEDAGYEILKATSAEQALEVIRDNAEIHFLLSDVIMPDGMNGFELCIKATDLMPTIKVAITSGFTDKTKKTLVEGNLLARYLASTLLPKPYDRNQLIRYVRSHLDQDIIIEWSDSLSVGIEAIDSDHKILISLVNKLYSCTQEKSGDECFRNNLKELLDYTSWHFRREEILMQTCQYPNIGDHIKLHHHLEKQVAGLIEKSRRHMNSNEKDDLLRFLCQWLCNHIGVEDNQIKAYTTNYTAEIHEALKANSREIWDR